MSEYFFDFNIDKNILLKEERGISFDDIISLIENGKLLKILRHSNQEKYPNQFIYEIDVDGYVYVVPFVLDGKKIFLKTIYPSRKATKNFKENYNGKK
ncbi:MAG: DUF4258 domain-containing protein [Pseudomonadota bacterium]